MTVEVIKAEPSVVSHKEDDVKIVEEVIEVLDLKKEVEVEVKPAAVEKSSSFKEESNFVSDLKDHEKKALNELKSKLEEAILGNNLFKKDEPKVEEVVVVEKPKEEEEKKEEEKVEEKVEEEVCVKEEVEKVEEKEVEKVEEKEAEKVEEGEEVSKKVVEKKGLVESKSKFMQAFKGHHLFGKKSKKEVEEKKVEKEEGQEVEAPAKEEEEKKEESKPECDVKVDKPVEEVVEVVEEGEEVSKKVVEKKGLVESTSKFMQAFKGHHLFGKKSKKEVEEKKVEKEEGQEVEAPAKEEEKKEESKPECDDKVEKPVEEVVEVVEEVIKTEDCEVKEPKEAVVEEDIKTEDCEEEKKVDECVAEEVVVVVDKDISLWGVPLLPSKADEGTDVVLLKFLRARDFKVNDAFEMLKKTLEWRKEWKIDSILDEDLGNDLALAAYMSGVDREGHPICYNIFGALDNEELFQKTFGSEEKRDFFLRWRFQLMERGIEKLELKPSGVTSLLQINDLKNSPGPAKKEVRLAIKQAVGLLQDNYPEFVARNIFINVPFWYYAYHALLSPFLTQRTKSKFVVARPAKVTETLLKYIPIEEIPIQYGGLKRDTDFEFSSEDGVASELVIKAASTATIEIPAPQAGTTFIWDIAVLGWEVNYKEEFVPTDECSYTIIVQKSKKLGAIEGPVRNTFRTNEAGKIVLTIENCSNKKKKVFYRHKVKKCAF